MSETQRRVTATFEATDDGGSQFHVVEYTVFRHTTTAEITYGDEGIKEYELTDGTILNRLTESQFEIQTSGEKIRRKV